MKSCDWRRRGANRRRALGNTANTRAEGTLVWMIVPEFELGNFAHEGFPFSLRGGNGIDGKLSTVVLVLIRVIQRRQESNQQIQRIERQSIGHNVKSLQQIHAQEVCEQQHASSNPTIHGMTSRTIEMLLIP